MPGNSIGHIYRLTTFGESHGKAIGGVIDGLPAGLTVDYSFLQQELKRRMPLYPGSTARKEPDEVEFLSGISNGISLGTPVGFIIKNVGDQPADYDELSGLYRPSHADYSYEKKYGNTGVSGGGRASGRETVARVVAGAVAKLLLKLSGVEIHAFVSQIGSVIPEIDLKQADLAAAKDSPYGCLDKETEKKIAAIINDAESKGDTLGGVITAMIKGTPPGLGEPVFDKLQANLAKAMLSIGSSKAFEYGLGFKSSLWMGSDYNDQMTVKEGKITFKTNHDGGIQGGISNGEDILFRVGFKPIPSVKVSQSTVNRMGEAAEIKIGGRHDTCHVPRLVVVVEAMAALVMADHLLLARSSRI